MKTAHLFPIFLAIFFASCGSKTAENGDGQEIDTIQTASGLKYYYLTKGEGPAVQKGSEVSTYLSLKVGDSVIWTSANPKDSLFSFIAGYSKLITGFNEVALLLREGDEIAAILPPELAYGTEGIPNVIPPNSTITYDHMKIVKVGEPKLPLSEAMETALANGGFEGMVLLYDQANNTTDSVKYHRGMIELFTLWEKLTEKEDHENAAMLGEFFGDKLQEPRLRYSAVLSYEFAGNYELAKERLLVLLNEQPNIPILQSKLMELEEKMANPQP